jgi:hypothetical protein
MSNYFFGQTPESVLGGVPRYFYALRRDADGVLYFTRIDQLKDKDSINVNTIGSEAENYTGFEAGIDFFEGRSVDHTRPFDNLVYDQYRWTDTSVYYYINADGELVARINESYSNYPE